VTGGNDSLTLLDALEDAKTRANPRFNGNGIVIDGRKCPPDAKPHHVIIRNTTVLKCPGGGIVGLETDHLTVEDCRVFESSWYCRYAASGITTLNNWTFDDAPGYHIVIRRNLVWNNRTLVPWERIGKSERRQRHPPRCHRPEKRRLHQPRRRRRRLGPARPRQALAPQWKGRALIANNLSAYNGGSGIHTFRTRHVDIVQNTTYWNGQVVGYPNSFPISAPMW